MKACKYYRTLTIGFALLLAQTSCKKIVDVDGPRNELVTTSVFKDSANAVAAITGMYVEMINVSTVLQFGNGAITVYTGLSGDELIPTRDNASENEFFQNNISKENGLVAGLWTQAYKTIYLANACINGLSQSQTLPETLKTTLIAEARFVRAFVYYHLSALYGEVPYISTIDFKDNAATGTTPKDSLMQILAGELTEISTQLPEISAPPNKARPCKYAAMALASRVYLTLQQWQKAEQSASAVIASRSYGLETDLSNVFKVSSIESIWQLPAMQAGYETSEAYQFVPQNPGYPPAFTITPALLNAFETGDNRMSKWIDSIDVNSQKYYYPFKYSIYYDGNEFSEQPYVIFRLAECYLIRAEARAQLEKLQEAASDINVIRSRAGLSDIHPGDRESLLKAVEQERRIELFCEWGHRWFDLKRTHAIDQLSKVKPGWQNTDALYPIPFKEILLNPFLRQNEGY